MNKTAIRFACSLTLALLPLATAAKCAFIEYRIKGRVTLSDVTGPQVASVSVAWEDSLGRHTADRVTDGDGDFTVPLPVLTFSESPEPSDGTVRCGYFLSHAMVTASSPGFMTTQQKVRFEGYTAMVELALRREGAPPHEGGAP